MAVRLTAIVRQGSQWSIPALPAIRFDRDFLMFAAWDAHGCDETGLQQPLSVRHFSPNAHLLTHFLNLGVHKHDFTSEADVLDLQFDSRNLHLHFDVLAPADLEEVAAVSNSAPVFLERLLNEVTAALEADAAACWMFDREQSVGLLAEYRFSTPGLQDDLQGTRLNQRILNDTFTTQTARAVPFQIRSSPAIAFVLLVPVCGDYNLLHVWFGDVVDDARREFWF